MSLASKMLIGFLRLSGMRGKLAKGSQKTFEEAVSYNRKHPFIMPNDHKAIYEQLDIQTSFGVCPCLKSHSRTAAEIMLSCLHGAAAGC